MASDRRIAANRLNARKSTGPKTEDGKQHSRRNAIRHGLTAETIIDVLEDPADYEAFEADIKGDFRPRTTVEHELVVRLASLLWRLHRATAIESGLLQLQAEILRERKARNRTTNPLTNEKLKVCYSLIPSINISKPTTIGRVKNQQLNDPKSTLSESPNADEPAPLDMARSFLRLANLGNGVFERLGRYETSLWRQAAQTIILLDSFKQRAKYKRRCAAYRSRGVQQRRPPFFPAHFYEQR